MDIAGALVEGILHQPVDDTDDVLILGVDLTGLAEFDELLEVLYVAGHLARYLVAGTFHRLADAVELDQVRLEFSRVCQHAANGLFDDAIELVHPFGVVWIGNCDYDLVIGNLDRQYIEARSVGVGHDRGTGGNIHFQRIEIEAL